MIDTEYMKGRLESADMPKLPPQLSKLSYTGKWLDTKHKTKHWWRKTDADVQNLFWITPYFSSKIDVLDISKHVLLLLDLLAVPLGKGS